MSVKTHFKCALRVAFCLSLIVFLVLINMKRTFNSKGEPTDNLIATERKVQIPTFSIPDRIFKKDDIKTEIDMLRVDALKGETIDLEV